MIEIQSDQMRKQ